MSKYSANDHTSLAGRRAVAYDRLRESGVPRESAARIAREAAEKQLGVEQSFAGPSKTTPITTGEAKANPFRVPFHWEK